MGQQVKIQYWFQRIVCVRMIPLPRATCQICLKYDGHTRNLSE